MVNASCRLVDVAGFRTDHNASGIVCPDKTVVDVHVVCIGNRIDDKTAFQCYCIIIRPDEAVADLYVAAADHIDSVSVELPADHVHSVDGNSVRLRYDHVPSRTVNHRDVLDAEVAGVDVLGVCGDQEVTVAVHVVSPVLHLFSGKDAMSGYGYVAATGLDICKDLCIG